jgi:hypothetical protein
MQNTSALRSTGLIAHSAVQAYFEPLTWLWRYVRRQLLATDDRVERRQFEVVFASVLLICGLFFTIGYVMGRTQYGGVVNASPFAFYKTFAHGQVFIEVAEVERESDAITVVHGLQKTGFPVVLLLPHSDNRYSVLVGPYADAKSAQAAVGQLKAKGYSAGAAVKLKE